MSAWSLSVYVVLMRFYIDPKKTFIPFPYDDDEYFPFEAGSDDKDFTFGLSLPPPLLLWSLELASVDVGCAAFDLFSKDCPNFLNFFLASVVTCPWLLEPSCTWVLITGSESSVFPLTLRIFSLTSWWENPSPYFNWGIRLQSKGFLVTGVVKPINDCCLFNSLSIELG